MLIKNLTPNLSSLDMITAQKNLSYRGYMKWILKKIYEDRDETIEVYPTIYKEVTDRLNEEIDSWREVSDNPPMNPEGLV